ncbi:sulfotransferase family 2 domain-containing protein [Rhodovulum sp. DZ06]|uniref:sulfotransferase family 2 domain-containing protein n=1 Tax=Rhodovulum sp. DZ06 TaxID=3425126 RepID=UPI003D331AE1
MTHSARPAPPFDAGLRPSPLQEALGSDAVRMAAATPEASEMQVPGLAAIAAALRGLRGEAPAPAAAPPEGPPPAQDRRASAADLPRDLPALLLTARRAPVYALPIAKCGCTWLKNLLWLLDNPRPHPHPLDIHRTQDRDLLRAVHVTPLQVAASPYGFVLVRDPADRLLSLYFDKVHSDRAFPWLRERLGARGAPVHADPDDVEAHGAVFDALIEEAAASIARAPGAMKLNPHWRPQAARLHRARALRLLRIPVPAAEKMVGDLLEPAIPEIREILARVPVRNAAPRPAPRDAVLTPARRAAIDAIYPRDRELYDHALEAARTRFGVA